MPEFEQNKQQSAGDVEPGAWADSENAKLLDGAVASTTLNTGQTSDVLALTNYSFDDYVPDTARITGIDVACTVAKSGLGTAAWSGCKLLDGDGVAVGDPQTAGDWPASLTTYTFSYGESDLLGIIDANDVRSASFGFQIRAKGSVAQVTAQVDAVLITVTYVLVGASVPAAAQVYVSGGVASQVAVHSTNEFFRAGATVSASSSVGAIAQQTYAVNAIAQEVHA